MTENPTDLNIERKIRELKAMMKERGEQMDEQQEARLREAYAWYFAQPDCPARCVQNTP